MLTVRHDSLSTKRERGRILLESVATSFSGLLAVENGVWTSPEQAVNAAAGVGLDLGDTCATLLVTRLEFTSAER